MNLLHAPLGKEVRIKSIQADAKTTKHLAALGVAVDSIVTIFEAQWGACVIYVKESKLALGHSTAVAIEVEPVKGGNHD